MQPLRLHSVTSYTTSVQNIGVLQPRFEGSSGEAAFSQQLPTLRNLLR
jgi:hypothetical protein